MSVRTWNPASTTEQDPRWRVVVSRAPDAEDRFYYSVSTTGIYCRPSCPSRLPRPENVQFHNSREDAEKAGFRPCKRCKPDQLSLLEQHAARISDVCRFIENSETIPGLNELAAHAGLSAHYFHRVFKALTGITPRAYAVAQRDGRIRNKLDHSNTVSSAIFDAGYNSNSRFYEKSNQLLGMTPTRYRSGGTDTVIRFAIGECSLGSILVASSDRGVCAILLGDDPVKLVRDLQDKFPKSSLVGGDGEFEKFVATVVGFVDSPAIGLALPLDIRGTAFQQRVWQALRKIPAGTTVSYTDIAKCIGAPESVRAVASACAANILAVAIPCHRVVRTDGSLSGYRWGVARKRKLLQKERESSQDQK